MSLLRLYMRVLALLAPERRLAVTLAVANLALAGVFFIEPVLFGKVVDALGASTPGAAPRLIALWAAVGFVGVAAGVWASLHADRLAHRRRLAAIALFFEHAASLSIGFHSEHHTGRLARIMNNGVGNLFGLWLSFFREHLATLFAIVVMIPLALWMNWKLALLMIALMAIFAFSNAFAIRKTHRAQAEVEELHHEIATRAGDVFGNVSIVQSFTRLAAEAADLRGMMRQVLAAQYPVLRGWAILSVLNRAASTLTIVAIFALGASLHARGEITVGGIVSFVGFSMLLIGRLEQFASFISGLFFQTQSLRDFFAVLDERPAIVERPDALELVSVRGDVAFEHVSFGYDPVQPALHGLSFNVPAGSTVALVGPTGAGKTTALSLLYRAYDPSAGRITIDGHDIRDVTLDSLRRNVGVVFQDPGMFYRSILENLRIGRPDAPIDEIEQAVAAAEAAVFIARKPEGMETLVAERGRSLSGGERQRLAIARAMLKNAPILVLDEATSALDNATEVRIQRALATLTKGRTTFVIAHRLSTVRHADLILVLDQGRLVERGRFDALIAQGGLFARLAEDGKFAPDAEPVGEGEELA
ncbi:MULTISPECIES: glucan ABC transporter ATP-binding protein/ permease [Dyella]|uniref:Glucan ABC transporter ATP-binding protein/ permease n=2 Tax=Dyella TaxID=231454 RepID=A0A4R0YUI7_9GAMM|nr:MULTISPECIES: glucan ABC transporter ATP-binding protein/ permease [Dyella]TBR40287.1 glucan ABC transporter ATP-binding protein/ permease [Dyella terrae]TCI12131.1 glucan ABC transporter ATP-binding protein/ permease [Dyella soli]